MKKNILGEILGWYGTVAIVAAYAMSSFKYYLGRDCFNRNN